MAANKHKGEAELKVEGRAKPLLLIFDANAYAHLEGAWGVSMKGVIAEISTWTEETLSITKLKTLLCALACRHNPVDELEAGDILGMPPKEVVMQKMMEAVEFSLPKAAPGEQKPPARQRVKKA